MINEHTLAMKIMICLLSQHKGTWNLTWNRLTVLKCACVCLKEREREKGQ